MTLLWDDGTLSIWTFLEGKSFQSSVATKHVTIQRQMLDQKHSTCNSGPYFAIATSARKQFYRDLNCVLANLRKKGHSIILASDFNKSMGDDPNGLDRLIIKHGLMDLVTYRHGHHNTPTYYRGSKRIDYIFVSYEWKYYPSMKSSHPITELSSSTLTQKHL